MPSPLPSERKLFSSYKLWRRYADPDGLVSAREFAEMDEDDKREALRELGGMLPAAATTEQDDDEEEDDAPRAPRGGAAHGDDPLEGDVEELTDDIADPRSSDPFA